MRFLIPTLMALGLALSACAPTVETSEPTPQPTPQDQAACLAQGGDWRREGLLGRYMCVLPYADAGKACTDGDQCMGDCRLSDGPSLPSSTTASGVCQANSSPFGCFANVEDGKVAAALCVD